MGLALAVVIIVNVKLRHYLEVAAIAEFPYGNTSIVEKIVGLACDFLIGRLSDSESSACPQSRRK